MRIVCECGCEVADHCLARHVQTEKHRSHLEMKVRGEQPKTRLEKQREYREINKEQISDRMKNYREQNKETIQEQRKTYREENRELVKKYREERIMCECGCEVGKHDFAKHLKTKKHQRLLIAS